MVWIWIRKKKYRKSQKGVSEWLSIFSREKIKYDTFDYITHRLIFTTGEPHRKGFLVGLKVTTMENENHET